MDRRRFLKGAAAAGLAASVSAPAWAAPVFQPAKWDEEADIVIVGYGAAGASAALGAREKGASVIILEKGKGPSGATPKSGGTLWFPLNPLNTEREDSVDKVFTYLQNCAKGEADDKIVRLFAEGSKATAEWIMKDVGLKATQPNRFDYHPFYQGAGQGRNFSSEGGGAGLMKVLATAAEAKGAQVRNEVKAQKLAVDANGKVVGVMATGADGKQKAYGAKIAVILCAGGFCSNEAWKREYLKVYPCLAQVPGLNGEGIAMGMAVGAGLRGMNTDVGVPLYRVADADNTQIGVGASVRTRETSIMVNRKGQRFCNESADYDSVMSAFYAWDLQADAYANVPAWFVFDDTARAAGAVVSGFSKDNLAEIDKGLVKKANTIKELAALLKIDPDALQATVDAYNKAAADGKDPLFGRGTLAGTPGPKPLATAPFYAYEAYPGLYDTAGGLWINEKCQVLSALGDVIPGLYSGGTNAHMALGYFYPNGGTAIAQAIFFGRLAGQMAGTKV